MPPKIPLNSPMQRLAECINMDNSDVPRLLVITCGVQNDGTITPIKVDAEGRIVLSVG
jgi:hypothetical protein